ncbi:MAG: ComF family protein [Chloroflexota bacterium]
MQENRPEGRVAGFRFLGLARDAIIELLFPARCVGCGQEGAFLCAPCRDGLPRHLPPYCLKCGEGLLPNASGSALCLRCRQVPLEIDGIRSPYLFQGTVREAVHALKYRHLRALAPTLAHLLRQHLEAQPLPVEILVPVPLHRRRLRERGYNQAALLARELGKLLDLPVVEPALGRTRDAPPQARATTAEERRRNVAQAFVAGPGVEGKSALLIDDVCTTGATLEACAQALKKAGAASVWGLTLAREA